MKHIINKNENKKQDFIYFNLKKIKLNIKIVNKY